MISQAEKAAQFRQLHVPGQPLVLYNVWDRCSAVAVAASGARAIATGSWAIAHANGYADGENIPLDLAIANLVRIVEALPELPVSADIESGYGATPQAVAQTVARTIAAGAIGCNLEDSRPADGTLRDIAEQVERIRHARQATEASLPDYFINARTDVFFHNDADQHDEAMLEHAIERAHAYAAAGASGLFVPGLVDLRLIGKLTAATPLPVNILAMPKAPPRAQLLQAGVARISYGAISYRQMIQTLEQAARAALVG